MQTRVIVAAVVQHGDTILLGKKAKGRPPYPDVWHTLGGGANDTEKALGLVQAGKYDDPYFHVELQREFMEEANITLKNIHNICPQYRSKPREAVTKNKYGEDTHYYFLEYLSELASGEARPGDDIAEIQWVTLEKLKNMPLTPPSREMYQELGWL